MGRCNQFFFWPAYRYQDTRRGENAILFIVGEKRPPPASLLAEFETVTSLGVVDVKRRGRVFHRVQLFACRNLL